MTDITDYANALGRLEHALTVVDHFDRLRTFGPPGRLVAWFYRGRERAARERIADAGRGAFPGLYDDDTVPPLTPPLVWKAGA